MGHFSIFSLLSVAIYYGIIFFVIYALLKIIKLMKQKNEYLKDIREEIRNSKSTQNNI
jgi:heme exporter protein D